MAREPEAAPPVSVPETPAADAAPSSRLGVLRHSAFRTIWIAAFASSVGTWMEQTGAQWLITDLTGSSAMVGTLAASAMGASMLFGLMGGVVADRSDRRKMLLITQGLMMVVAATLTAITFLGFVTPMWLIALSFCQGTVMAFNIAAWTTVTPRLVPRADLPKAIALNSLQFNAARIIGPAIAGFVIASAGTGWVFLVNTLSFLAVLFAVTRTPPTPPDPNIDRSSARAIREGFAFVFQGRGPRAVFIGVALFAMLAVPMRHQLSIFARNVYGLDERAFGMMLGIMGAGAVAGGLAMQHIPTTFPRRRLIPISITSAGVFIGLFAMAPNVWIGGPLLFASGWFWLWSFSASWSAVQLLVPDRLGGRVVSVNTTLMFGMMALGNVLVGGVGDAIGGAVGPQLAVGGAAGVLVLCGLVMLRAAPAEIDHDPEVEGQSHAPPGPGEASGSRAE